MYGSYTHIINALRPPRWPSDANRKNQILLDFPLPLVSVCFNRSKFEFSNDLLVMLLGRNVCL